MIEITCDKLFGSVPPYLARLFNSTKYPWEVLKNIDSYIKEIQQECQEGRVLRCFPRLFPLKRGVLF